MKKRKGSVGYTLQRKDTAVKEDKSIIKRILNTILIVFAAVVLGFGVTQFVMQSVYMTGPSMQSTLKDGDEMLLNKFAYKIGKIKRFDIVAIKRINGLPDLQHFSGPIEQRAYIQKADPKAVWQGYYAVEIFHN